MENYEERVIMSELETLQYRRKKKDLVFAYKIINNLTCLSPSYFFSERTTTYELRGHSQVLTTDRSKNKVVDQFWPQRVKKTWNQLPQNVISSPSVAVFKRRLSEEISIINQDLIFPQPN